MAKKNKSQKNKNVLINHIEIRQIQRTSQDINNWRSAIRTAESTVNPTRRLLYDLYSDILLDGHLSSVVGKRLGAVENSPLVFNDADGNEVEEITNLIDTEEFEELLTEILNAKFWGYSLLELEFNPEKIIPALIDRRHVKPEKGIIVKNPNDLTGLNYTEPPYNKFALTSGKPKDLGLLMKVAQYVIYKRGNYGDWAQFAEIFGMPFRKGKYDGYDDKARIQLENALKNAGSAAYVVLPEGTDLDFETNNSTGDGELYDKLRKACNEEISVCIAGETLTTTQGDKGARSLGEVHKEVADEKQVADKRFVRRVLNSKLKPLLEIHGYNVKGGSFTFPEVEKIDKTKKINIDLRIANRQPVGDDYFYGTYGIPKPDNYDQLKEEQKLDREMLRTLKNPTEKKETANLLNTFKSFFRTAPTS
jgi:phage gp29-like protein